jgi:hypothetical protein
VLTGGPSAARFCDPPILMSPSPHPIEVEGRPLISLCRLSSVLPTQSGRMPSCTAASERACAAFFDLQRQLLATRTSMSPVSAFGARLRIRQSLIAFSSYIIYPTAFLDAVLSFLIPFGSVPCANPTAKSALSQFPSSHVRLREVRCTNPPQKQGRNSPAAQPVAAPTVDLALVQCPLHRDFIVALEIAPGKLLADGRGLNAKPRFPDSRGSI